jgi:hypothetical protein
MKIGMFKNLFVFWLQSQQRLELIFVLWLEGQLGSIFSSSAEEYVTLHKYLSLHPSFHELLFSITHP